MAQQNDTSPQAPSDLSDPLSLVAIARAARLTGDRHLERAARRLLREQYGMKVSFSRPLIKKGASNVA